MFVTFEGIDGSGKTTLINLLSENLKASGIRRIITAEPENLPDPEVIENGPKAELAFFVNDRKNHVKHVILPALNDNILVLCDRFHDSTIAYQGYGRGMPLRELADNACGIFLTPDLTFLLDLPVDEAQKRITRRKRESGAPVSLASFDAETRAFHNRVRNGYLTLASQDQARFVVLDGTLPPAQLLAQVLKHIAKKMEELNE